eukprot:Amastigsp_a339627_93.p2 type:complete len:117 gc:universal Amastigsp_a339627_93:436-786(+)
MDALERAPCSVELLPQRLDREPMVHGLVENVSARLEQRVELVRAQPKHSLKLRLFRLVERLAARRVQIRKNARHKQRKPLAVDPVHHGNRRAKLDRQIKDVGFATGSSRSCSSCNL